MKNTLLKTLTAVSLFAICSCNKGDNCNNFYTVSGTLLNGETGQPFTDSGTKIALDNSGNLDLNENGFNMSTMPDKNGKFSFTYNSCGAYEEDLELGLNTPNRKYVLINPYDSSSDQQIPIEQNINRTWYVSLKGWIVIRLQPLSPLPPGDTLLIDFYCGDSLQKYTILYTQNGILDSAYLPAGVYSLNWGRGKKNEFKNVHGGLTGDPNITGYTIKY